MGMNVPIILCVCNRIKLQRHQKTILDLRVSGWSMHLQKGCSNSFSVQRFLWFVVCLKCMWSVDNTYSVCTRRKLQFHQKTTSDSESLVGLYTCYTSCSNDHWLLVCLRCTWRADHTSVRTGRSPQRHQWGRHLGLRVHADPRRPQRHLGAGGQVVLQQRAGARLPVDTRSATSGMSRYS